MIDTIRGYINIGHSCHSNFEHLIQNKVISIKDDTYSISFNVSNFKIRIRFNSEDIPIKLFFYGSLPKYYYGNNLAQLDWDSTKKAIQKLSDELSLDLDDAILTRVDVGINLIVKNPVHEYISSLVSFPRLESMRFKDSVKFFSKSNYKAITFYDKLNEIRGKDKSIYNSIDEVYRNSNILRFEVCLMKSLKRKLGLDRVYVKDLYRDTVQSKLERILFNYYDKVVKVSIGVNPTYLLPHHNGVYKYLSYHGIDKLGYDRFSNTVSGLQFNVKNPASKRSKMKSAIKELMHNVKENALDDDLVAELDNKMKFINELIN